MLNLPVHGSIRPEPAPPLLQAAPVRQEPLGPNPHHLLIAVRQADTSCAAAAPAWMPPPRPTSRRSWATSSATACSVRVGSRDGCAMSSSNARVCRTALLPWAPLTGRRPRPQTRARPRPSADRAQPPHEPRDQRRPWRHAGLTRPAPRHNEPSRSRDAHCEPDGSKCPINVSCTSSHHSAQEQTTAGKDRGTDRSFMSLCVK
jgi:hypothetical protein